MTRGHIQHELATRYTRRFSREAARLNRLAADLERSQHERRRSPLAARYRRAPVVAAIVAVVAALAAGAAGAVTPADGGDGGGGTITIDNGPGSQVDPHVSGDQIAYTDQDIGRIRYYDIVSAAGGVVPTPPGSLDTLSSVSGSRIAFARQTGIERAVVVYDVASGTSVEIGPNNGAFATAIAGDTVAFVSSNSGNGDILVADLSAPSAPPQNLSASPDFDANPNLAPDGNTVVWETCDGTFTNCGVLRAVRTSGIWGTAEAVSNTAASELNPDTDGGTIIYDSDRPSATGQDIYFQPVAGGTETQLSLAGIQLNPSISEGVVSFESRDTPSTYADLFVYVIATNTTYRVTSTPTVHESLNDIDVLPNGDVRVVWAANDDIGFQHNIYARTFTVPLTPADSTPPAITPTVTGTLGANGWYTSDVGLSWDVSEPESPGSLVETGCVDQAITADQPATSYSCAASSDGGSAGPVEVTIKRDATAPTLAFSGNAGSYDVSQTISIGCAASDGLSGIATDCAGVSAPAHTFPPGANTIARSATDNAGNTGTGSATFTVVVDPQSLCALTRTFVQGSAPYQALPRSAQRLVDASVSASCAILLKIGPQLLPAQKAAFINSYVAAVQALARAGWLTQPQASTLAKLAGAL